MRAFRASYAITDAKAHSGKLKGGFVATPFLVPTHPWAPEALIRPRPSSVEAYLARLGPGSRRGQRQALNAIAWFLSDGVLEADEIDWASIRYRDTSAVRSWLVKRYAPNTAKRLLAALRGVLKECWRMGVMQYDDLARATDLGSVLGESEPSGRALSMEELQKVFDACNRDTALCCHLGPSRQVANLPPGAGASFSPNAV